VDRSVSRRAHMWPSEMNLMGLSAVKCELGAQWGGVITRDHNSTVCAERSDMTHGKIKEEHQRVEWRGPRAFL